MSARADLSTKDGEIFCRVFPDKGKVVEFQLPVIQTLGLAAALADFGFKVLPANASAHHQMVRDLIEELPVPTVRIR